MMLLHPEAIIIFSTHRAPLESHPGRVGRGRQPPHDFGEQPQVCDRKSSGCTISSSTWFLSHGLWWLSQLSMPSSLFFKGVNNNIWVEFVSDGMCCISWQQSEVCKILTQEHEFLCVPQTLAIKSTRTNPTSPSLRGMHGPEHTDVREPAWHLHRGSGVFRSWAAPHGAALLSPFGHERPHRTLTSGEDPPKSLQNETKQEHFIILSKDIEKYGHSAIAQLSNIPVALGKDDWLQFLYQSQFYPCSRRPSLQIRLCSWDA